MTDYDDTQEIAGVASGSQVLESLEEALGVDYRVGLVRCVHRASLALGIEVTTIGNRWLLQREKKTRRRIHRA